MKIPTDGANRNCFRALKLILVAITLIGWLLSSTSVKAQAALFVLIFGDKVATEKFHLTIDGGLNISSMPGLAEGKSSYGGSFGLGTFIKLSDKWALTPEFKPLSQRGANDVNAIIPIDVAIQNPKTDFATNTIDVPILLRYKISKSLFVATGPQISILTSAKQKTTGTTTSGQDVLVTQDIQSLMNKQNFMIPLEIGYSFSEKRNGKGIDLKLRYNFGVTEVFAETSGVVSKNSTLQFILSFPFINSPSENK